MQDDRTLVVVAVGGGLALALLGLLLWLRGPSAGPERPGATPVPPPEPGVAVPAAAAAGAESVPAVTPAAREPTAPAATEITPVPKPEARATAEADANGVPWEFTQEDLKTVGRGVRLDMGDYRVAVGTEVEIALVLEAPPLESVTLVMLYDKDVLQFVDGSAKPVGPVFRRGLEFYCDPATSRLALIHSGVPGQKNLLAAANEKVVTFRFKALKAGSTALRTADKGVSFTNAAGTAEVVNLSGGRVVVTE